VRARDSGSESGRRQLRLRRLASARSAARDAPLRHRQNPEVTGFRDVFGTAVGGERIWALPFLPGGEWARTDAAVFDGVAGKVMKIVFRMREYHAFSAVGPDGTASKPAWGPVAHSDSNWNRPGREWGAGFLLSEPGCWRIRAGRVGDVWLLIRS
jgi:hypothetical protein